MSLNATPSANRTHIAFFGCRNAGKSSMVNAVTGQPVSIVSDTKSKTGTRTCIESPLALISPLWLGNHNVIDTCSTEIEVS